MSTEKTIGDVIPSRSPLSFAPGDQATAAVAAMKEQKADCVLVCDSDGMKGVFTQRDFLNRVAAVGKSDAPLGDVMTRDPASLDEGDSVHTALRRMAVGNYRNIPVLGADGGVSANLSVWEVMKHISDRFADDWSEIGAASVEALYHRPAVEVESTETLLNVLNLMVQRSCGAVRVNQADSLVGIFTEQDLMHRVDYSSSEWHSTPVSEVMTRAPLSIERDMTVAAALSLMNEKSYRHLPVVDDPSEEITRLVSIREILGFVSSRLDA